MTPVSTLCKHAGGLSSLSSETNFGIVRHCNGFFFSLKFVKSGHRTWKPDQLSLEQRDEIEDQLTECLLVRYLDFFWYISQDRWLLLLGVSFN